MKEFPILMKFLRERSDVSARHLSSASDLSLSYISKMEKGQVMPTVEVFAKIVRNLDISDAEIIYLIKNLAEGEADQV